MKKRNQCLVIILSLMIGIIYPVSETSITDDNNESDTDCYSETIVDSDSPIDFLFTRW